MQVDNGFFTNRKIVEQVNLAKDSLEVQFRSKCYFAAF